MKYLLTKGEISELINDSGGGLSGEVYLVKHKDKKYILRKCKNIQRAKKYEFVSSKFEKYGFLPKFLGRKRKNVFYEYIEGMDLTKKDKNIKFLHDIGKISAHINKIKKEGNDNVRFNRHIKELVTGKYIQTDKIMMRKLKDRYKEKLDKRRIKPLLNNYEVNKIKMVYQILKKRVKPEFVLDINDTSPANFRLRRGKIYFVDIEAIKGRWKGLGIAKGFIQWITSEKEQNAFKKGYESISSMNFFTEDYKDFIYINFLVQALSYKAAIGRDYGKDLILLKKIIKKYKK